MKIIITEGQYNLLFEQFDSEYYDIILDLYNEVGLEGMTDEEIEYLKSGGQSNVPERFLGGDLDIDSEESEDMDSRKLWTGLTTRLLIPLPTVS